MAIYPCAMGQHRYAGQQNAIYVTQLRGSSPETVRLRLCPSHYADVVTAARESMTDVSEGGQSSLLCESCEKPRSTTVFARCFAKGTEEETYAADLCDTCAIRVTHALAVANGDHLAGR